MTDTSSGSGGTRPLLAEDLLRAVLQAGGGALPRRGVRQRHGSARRLDVVLRAALFCDLIQRGAITGVVAPVAGQTGLGGTGVGGAGLGQTATPDRILGAVAGAVARRPDVPWARWFTHLSDDRAVLVDRLVGSGQWTAAGRLRFVDTAPAGAERLLARTYTVAELISAPADARETALGYLFALTGPAMTAERVLGWDVRLAALDGIAGAVGGSAVRAVLAAAKSAAWPGWRRRRDRRHRTV